MIARETAPPAPPNGGQILSFPGAEQDETGDVMLQGWRIDYAKASFAHMQDLVRFMDQKAASILGVVGVLTSTLGIFTSVVLNVSSRGAWRSPLGVVGGGLAFTYLALAFAVAYTASSVYMAVSRRNTTDGPGPGLMYPMTLVHRFEAPEKMAALKLAHAQPVDIIKDYASSMTTVAGIYLAKESRVNQSVRWLRCLGGVWLLAVTLLLGVAVVA